MQMPELEADYIIQPPEGFDCSFEIYATGTVWGAIEGDIENQTDLKNALDSKADDTEITEIDGRLDTIESTLSGYGNIVTHNVSEFATAAQGALADSAVQPSDLNNYVPNTRTVNNKALSSNITLNYSDVGALASTTTINDLTTTAQQNALNSGITSTDVTLIGTALQPNDDITELNNNAGYITGITSTDVTNALGYTPYNSTNPNGYITGITSTDVTTALGYTPYNSTNPNNYSSTLNGLTDVSLTSPTQGQNLTYDAVNQKWINSSTTATVGWGGITGTLSDQTDLQNALDGKYDISNPSGYITSSDLPTNYVTTDTDQNITGTKTYVGQKKIAFKQSGTSDKLGFTLYNNSNTEKGYLEYNPSNTVDSVPLMTLGNYASASGGLTHVGFRKYSSISGASGAYNLLAPLISDAKTPFSLTTTYTNFYLPLGFTDGNTTVLTNKSGMVDLSSIIPTIPTVNNATLTIQQNGTNVQTFTANASSDVTANITVPTDVSDLTNTTLANVSLSNLNTNGEGRLHALKGYTESGQVYSDTQLYNDILAQYHSSFDLSKFTVTGSPTITDDGVVSGFSASDLVGFSATITSSATIEIDVTVEYAPTTATYQGIMSGSDWNIAIMQNGNVNWYYGQQDLFVTSTALGGLVKGDILDIITTVSTTTKTIKVRKNGGEWQTNTSSGTYTTGSLNVTVGKANTLYCVGSIFLGSINVKENGVTVFNGAKTGTDLIITDNYTVVGSPTITDGVASGFSYSAGNYVTTSPFLQNLGDYDTWELEIPVTLGASLTNRFDVVFQNIDSNNNEKFMCQLRYNVLRCYIKAQDDTNIAYDVRTSDTFSANDSLVLKLQFTGTQYIISTKLSGGAWKVQNTINSSKKVFKTNTPFVIGCNPLYTDDSNNWKGNINLWGIKFIGNGNLIYAGKDTITYNLTADGTKIADVQYRPDVYYANYLGYKSSYFTIDTTNQNVTLPYRNLYALITQSFNYNYTRIQGYDGTATQTLKNVNGVLQWVSDT